MMGPAFVAVLRHATKLVYVQLVATRIVMVKGEATLDELFAIYKLDAGPCEKLTKRVDKRYYDCWNTEPAGEDEEAA